MRLSPLIFLMLAGSLAASEPAPAYPLWDGVESVADYAKRVNLPATKTLDLGNGVKLELVLIPAGKFIMGTPEPMPVDEDGFYKKIVIGRALLAASVGTLLVMLAFVCFRAIRQKRRPQLSLGRLLMLTAVAGVAVLSGLHWRQSTYGLEQSRADYATAKPHYDFENPGENPAHPVTLTEPFYMEKYPVTQEQYMAVTGSNPSFFKGNDYPVETVSWDEAVDFCKRLRENSGLPVRLPTEAQWEYSCRAGTTTKFYSGDMEADLARVAWYTANSKNMTHPVGQKEPNPFGLYDMNGNVWQWCEDWRGNDYYSKSAAYNPEGPMQGTLRVLRGGCWRRQFWGCRSAHRGANAPGSRREDYGFRIVAPAPRAP